MLEHKPNSIFESARNVLEGSQVELEEAYKKGEKVKILLNPKDEHDTGEGNPKAKWGEGKIVQSWGHDEYDVKLLSNDSFAGHYKKGDTIPQIYGAQLRPLDESTELQEKNSDLYKWEDINVALMKAGLSTGVIMKVISALKGKEA